jgi:plasmid stabilization system protein ParE
MRLRWTTAATVDLRRLHAFLAPLDPRAATRTVRALREGAVRLQEHPRLGARLDRHDTNEVRRLIVGAYEMRYEIRDETVFVLRLFHSREDR